MDEDRQHSGPIQYPALESVIKGPVVDVLDNTPSNKVEAPPSIYALVHGNTFLKEVLNLEKDSDRSQIINDYLLERMKDEGIRNTAEGYQQILKQVLKDIGLTNKHEGQLIIDRIYQKFLDRTMNARDYLLFLNAIANREKEYGRSSSF